MCMPTVQLVLYAVQECAKFCKIFCEVEFYETLRNFHKGSHTNLGCSHRNRFANIKKVWFLDESSISGLVQLF